MDSKNIVVTNHRLKKDLTDVYEAVTGVKCSDMKTAVEDKVKIKIGKIKKWYMGVNRCQCFLDGKNVECSIVHSMFCNDSYISYTPYGRVKFDESDYYVEPVNDLYGALVELKSKNNAQYILVGFLDYNLNDINITPGNPGEYKIKNGSSVITIARNHIRLDCNQLIINGLPYTEAKGEIEDLNFYTQSYIDENYYTKDEIEELLNKIKNSDDL